MNTWNDTKLYLFSELDIIIQVGWEITLMFIEDQDFSCVIVSIKYSTAFIDMIMSSSLY
jgi:hypothetical protein